ncbi:FAD-binding protein [Raoultibacter massiliensis]|uniref:FAD-binding protein n=1 Tax=Raoultibacter massiliensis TaxID=1852371 RepID=UPI003A944BDD
MKETPLTKHGISRRSFLGLGATAAVIAGAGLAGCSPAAKETGSASGGSASAGSAAASTGTASFLVAPDPIADSDITETIDAEIVVVGAGISGISAVRSAVENGAKDIVVVEKGTTWQYRSNQVGCIGGKIQEDLGIEIDKNAVVAQLMKECGYRPNQRILNLWAENSGEAFDWFLAPSEGSTLSKRNPTPTTARA